jgi:hypothetical protein
MTRIYDIMYNVAIWVLGNDDSFKLKVWLIFIGKSIPGMANAYSR